MSPSSDLSPAVLVIDDDEVYRARLCRGFLGRNWEVHSTQDPEAALRVAAQTGPDLVLVDLRMPDVSGLELIPRLRQIDDSMVIIMLTGYGSIATALEALKLGANHYLGKPADLDQVLSVYERIRGEAPGEPAAVPATVPSLARVEWEHIQRVLTDCGGNITQAAKLLGIHRRSLQRKLVKHPPAR